MELEAPSSLDTWIINLGTEILTGFTHNTNASWLARKLTFLGYNVKRIIVVPDHESEFGEELLRAIGKRIGILITTGGLGPTYDDSTYSMISKTLSLSLELNREALEMVKEYYSKLGKELTEDRIKMAKMPRGAIPLKNPVGAAPGMILGFNGTYIISLPGVPKEMESIFEGTIEQILTKWNKIHVKEEWIKVRGIMESSLAPHLKEIVRQFPQAYIKTHPRGSEKEPLLLIQILASSKNYEQLNTLIVEIKEKIVNVLNNLGGVVE
ncbi:MAG: nicotinamide mononucleotide deamidase-related protein [Fervidicoccaceae archaeon]